MKTCNRCMINENYPNVTFDSEGTCSICRDKSNYTPIGKNAFFKIIEDSKSKNAEYDALVPLSGGKDSTYILHLAVNIYKLKVIAMTYDNGFLSQPAIENIEKAVKISKVRHIWRRPDMDVLKKIYKYMLLLTGDICGACDIGTKANIIKVAEDLSVPIVLYGTSPLEEDSFVPDTIQDIRRFKYILNQTKEFTKKEINDFLIYPNLNNFKLSFYKWSGRFAKEVRPLFYIENPTDKEIGKIIENEFNWKDDNREYSKHFDCVAEPLTNYIRNKIYGYERRICQFSNMIRNNEISREHAVMLYAQDNIDSLPKNYNEILNSLNLTENDMDTIIANRPLKYEKHISKMDLLYSKIMTLMKK